MPCTLQHSQVIVHMRFFLGIFLSFGFLNPVSHHHHHYLHLHHSHFTLTVHSVFLSSLRTSCLLPVLCLSTLIHLVPHPFDHKGNIQAGPQWQCHWWHSHLPMKVVSWSLNFLDALWVSNVDNTLSISSNKLAPRQIALYFCRKSNADKQFTLIIYARVVAQK